MHCRCLLVSRRPVCLPPKAFGLPAESTMAVTGWGYLEENGEKPDTLPIIINQKCAILNNEITSLKLPL